MSNAFPKDRIEGVVNSLTEDNITYSLLIRRNPTKSIEERAVRRRYGRAILGS